MKKTFLFCCFLMVVLAIKAQDYSVFQKRRLVQGSDTMPYRILLPENYDTAKKYPVIFFLHGLGERGNDNKAQLLHGSESHHNSWDAASAEPQLLNWLFAQKREL